MYITFLVIFKNNQPGFSVQHRKDRSYLSDDANNMLTNWKNDTWLVVDDVPTNDIAALKEAYIGRDGQPDEFIIAGQIGTYYVCWNINEPLLP